MNLVDLHIHSVYSDGTLTPAEIVSRACGRGVSLISVTDHNALSGTREAEPIARAAGLQYLPGVEIDALFENTDVHILGYGADFENPRLAECIRRARQKLDGMSTELLARMLKDYPELSRAEYEAMVHDTRLGGWKLLEYLKRKGVTPKLHDGFAFYERYGVGYAQAGFEDAEAVVAALHAAGGRAVLAHPGVTFSTERLSAFEACVERALKTGLDGIECEYVRHTPGVTRRLYEICRRHDLMITAGSDCHGAFSANEIGQTGTPLDRIELKGLQTK